MKSDTSEQIPQPMDYINGFAAAKSMLQRGEATARYDCASRASCPLTNFAQAAAAASVLQFLISFTGIRPTRTVRRLELWAGEGPS